MEVRFSASDFAVIPDDIASWIIAHELAHVYQKAIGRRPNGDSIASNEADADEMAESWGFDKSRKMMLDLLMGNRGLSVEEACEKLSKKYPIRNRE